ncbi:hypothetical protein ACLGGT_21865 [Roseovarius sp. MS2]|uniref:hypothetical protein n=1 Tax=Roseovarius sp. MS2 TaxID=3390728 RepID=UPI003EDC2421
MKKQSKSPHSTTRAKPSSAGQSNEETVSESRLSRRDILRYLRNGTIAAGVLGFGGWSVSRTYAQQVELLDLDAIGNGTPTVVQVHDPHCPTCQELQKRTLRAAKDFEDGALQVRVANIRGPEGRAIADRYGVPHVTLLLFDGQGEMRRVISGLQEVSYLRDQFRSHVARFSQAS